MNTGMKITAFAAALTAAFGAAYGVGSSVDPMDVEPAPAAHAGHADSEEKTPAEAEGGGKVGGHELPGGLQVTDDGYTLDLRTPRLEAGEQETLRFAVLDENGEPVTEYRREHGRELHLILVSRDLTTYRHLHPSLAEDGTWSVDVGLSGAGGYRVFADFTPDAEGAGGLTLGTDLAVGGDYDPRALPEPSDTATVDDYTVTLDGGLAAGRPTELSLTVEKDGEPVTDLEPYLGAYGHLVALRAGDLAYLHVHPNGEPGDGSTEPGPEVSFTATAPSAGDYRLFLDFRHEGEVRSVAFTVRAADADGEGQTAPGHGAGGEGGGGHQH